MALWKTVSTSSFHESTTDSYICYSISQPAKRRSHSISSHLRTNPRGFQDREIKYSGDSYLPVGNAQNDGLLWDVGCCGVLCLQSHNRDGHGRIVRRYCYSVKRGIKRRGRAVLGSLRMMNC